MAGVSLERLLIVPDTHAPYHDERAWKLVLKIGRSFKPQVVVHQGDLMDCYPISTYSKDPSRRYTLNDEMVIARRLRKQLDGLGAKRKIFTEGNHEDRLPRYLWEKCPELYGMIEMDDKLGLSANGWEYVRYKDHARVGKVYFTHDTGNSGKYTTARALDAFQHSVSIGHHHQIQYAVEGDATGKYRVGAQFGWLGDIRQVDYRHKIKAKRAWALGFGIGYRDTETNYVWLVPVPIVNYCCIVEGRIYRG